MHFCTFRVFLGPRAVIRFLTLKGLRVSAIAGELQSVYETEAFALSTAEKWHKRSAQGRTSLYDDPRCGIPLTNDLTEAISSVLKERSYLSCKIFCRHFRITKGLACEFFMIRSR
jgi:hypothetical protein